MEAPFLSVVMPAHNEEGYLAAAVRSVVEGLLLREGAFELLVVENGSSDGTVAVARAMEGEIPQLRLLALPDADYGLALRAGLLAARGEVVVNFDVDLVDLDFLDQAEKVWREEGAAIVVGTKRGPGASDDRNLARRTVTAIFSTVLRVGFGLRVSDTHGAKLLDRQLTVALAQRCRFGQDIFDTELVLRAEQAGLTVAEIPVAVIDQRPPRTPIARRIPRSLLGLVRLRAALAGERSARSADSSTGR